MNLSFADVAPLLKTPAPRLHFALSQIASAVATRAASMTKAELYSLVCYDFLVQSGFEDHQAIPILMEFYRPLDQAVNETTPDTVPVLLSIVDQEYVVLSPVTNTVFTRAGIKTQLKPEPAVVVVTFLATAACQRIATKLARSDVPAEAGSAAGSVPSSG